MRHRWGNQHLWYGLGCLQIRKDQIASRLQVNAEAQRISREADQANAIAAECQAGLDKALPALAAAEEALNVLTKKDMSELKVSFYLAAL